MIIYYLMREGYVTLFVCVLFFSFFCFLIPDSAKGFNKNLNAELCMLHVSIYIYIGGNVVN